MVVINSTYIYVCLVTGGYVYNHDLPNTYIYVRVFLAQKKVFTPIFMLVRRDSEIFTKIQGGHVYIRALVF